jgi:phosphoribosylanthranilate isomerase
MNENKSISLKICGMRDPKNILDVATVLPEYMGFIFYKKSPRYVGESFSLPVGFPSSIKKVGVFVNEALDSIQQKVKNIPLDFIQLHGNESVEDCKQLKRSGFSIIKAFSVDEQFDFEVTKPYLECVDYFLFDTKGKFYGGNAVTFDWSILEKYNQQVPFFLSGGLNEQNISGIKNLQQMNLHAVDINSGVELSPGFKNVDQIKKIKDSLSLTSSKF